MILYQKYSGLIHLGLIFITFITTTISGMEWITGKIGPFEISELSTALPYSISVIFILGVHEFGHYFAARYHKVKSTLPFFIPFPPLAGFLNFGTMGAVIKTKSPVYTNKAMFDIGVAGPIAGFIACLIILIYGFVSLPGEQYLLNIHPDFFESVQTENYLSLKFGDSLLFIILREIFTSPGQFIPPMSEIYHYPYLCAGWFGLFITSMNLIPVGQLDGGHILFGIFGTKRHEIFANICWYALVIMGVFGGIDLLIENNFGIGWLGWLFWAIILRFVIKIKHPPVAYFEELGKGRKILGIISMIILILSFSPTPFIFINFSI